ncbi:MAG: head GIN domain-containing protein, partial [Bacteroidota bacterium]
MNQFKWISFLFCAAVLTFSACNIDLDDDDDGLFNCDEGEGDVITDVISIGDFTGVELKISADVYVRQGSPHEVQIEGQQNIIDQLDRDIDDDTWEIEFDDCVRDYEDLKIYITMPEIEKLSINSSGGMFSENTLVTEDLVLRISGSGDMDLELDAEEVDSKITGSGDIQLAGNTEEFELEINGSGDFRAFSLNSERGDIEIKGSGDAEVTVEKVLDVKVTGSGDILYRGNPTLNVDITGSG